MRSCVHLAPTAVQRVVFRGDSGAFRSTSLYDLCRALFVFRLCASRRLVSQAPKLLKTSEALVGRWLTYNTFVKWSVFDHFCAATNADNLAPNLSRLSRNLIGPILDYAAEADVDGGGDAEVLETNLQNALLRDNFRYSSSGDALFDANTQLFHDCMLHASNHLPPSGIAFSAIKVSGLCEPQLLVRVTAMLLSLRQGWVSLFVQAAPPPIEDCRVVINRSLQPSQRCITRANFIDGILRLSSKNKGAVTRDEAAALAIELDPQGTGSVDYLDYTNQVGCQLLSTGDVTPGEKVVPGRRVVTNPSPAMKKLLECLPRLTSSERKSLRLFEDRLFGILNRAVALKVRVMVDAEQSYLQMAIDHYVRELQREYNKKQPIVYNTYQCYLNYTSLRLQNDLQRAQREKWMWAGKMVRGAYMEQERALAVHHKYPSPIHDTKAQTDDCYDRCAAAILDLIAKPESEPIGVLFGSHNATSLQAIADRVFDLQIVPHRGEISFAQLYGMSDHLTLPLAHAGYNTFKYVPYGPVHETIPYLLRRANENSTMASMADTERGIMWAELKRRMFLR